MQIMRQTDRQMDGWTDGQADDRQTDRWMLYGDTLSTRFVIAMIKY